jgi:hypothetical protein
MNFIFSKISIFLLIFITIFLNSFALTCLPIPKKIFSLPTSSHQQIPPHFKFQITFNEVRYRINFNLNTQSQSVLVSSKVISGNRHFSFVSTIELDGSDNDFALFFGSLICGFSVNPFYEWTFVCECETKTNFVYLDRVHRFSHNYLVKTTFERKRFGQ